MRRHDREITDAARIDEIIGGCSVCRLGFFDGNEAYIVPMNFGFSHENGRRTLYFHSAAEGRKIDCIRRGGRVSFEMERAVRVYGDGDAACTYAAAFECVMGTGRVTLLDGEAKRAALVHLMNKAAGARAWEFSPAMVDAVCVFALEVETVSCKVHE